MEHQDFNNDELETTAAQEQEQQAVQQDQFKELYLRATADLQNIKRRVEKERAEWMYAAQAQILTPIVGIYDEMERALQAAQNADVAQSASWLEGFALMAKNFKKVLDQCSVEEIVSTGTFNPELHEALMHEESFVVPSGDIVKTFAKGYTLRGKVLRHAQVSVAK